MRYLFFVLLSLPGTLCAQEATVDTGSVLACFERTERGNTRPDCVGEAAAACSAASSMPEATLTMSECLMAEERAWDSLLNREYGKTRKAFGDQAGLADHLLAAQRAWIAFRDAECELAYARFGDGSMRTVAAGDCLLHHTARRTFELRDLQGF